MTASTVRAQRGWVADAAVLLVLIGVGVVGVARLPASAAPTAPPSAAGPPPSEARKAIGRAPRVDSPKTGAPPSVLGTVLVLHRTGQQLEVQPTAVDAGGKAPGADRRLVRVQVNVAAVTGSVAVSELDFALVDQAGTRYPSRPALAWGDVARLGPSTVPAGTRATGAVFFDVPARASSLVLAYVPAPSKAVAGRWLLSAP